MKQALTKSISISFKPDLFSKIDSYCAEHGCSRSWFVNKAVNLYLNECLEDLEDYNSAVAAWDEYEKNGKESFPAADVFLEAGL